MKMNRIILALLTVAAFGTARAQEVDLQQVVRETQISRQNGQQMNFVWYVPTEYWAESFKKSPGLGERQRQELLSAIDDYLVVAALEGTIGTLGVLAATPKDELEKKASVAIGDAVLKPLPESELSPGARTFVQIMKPVLANMLGPMGSGMHFVMFKGKDAQGNRVADPTKPGRLTFKMGEEEFNFRLPLGSLLPPKYDKGTGERFPGNYIYSPYTGKKLSTQP